VKGGHGHGLRLLVLAPYGNDAPLTTRLLKEAGLEAQTCANIDALAAEIETGCGAIMIAEESLGAESLRVLIGALNRQPSWSDVPIILITSSSEASNATLQRLTMFGPAGIVSLLERPFRPITMLNAAQVALRSRQRQYEIRDLLLERERLLASLEERVAQRTRDLREMNEQLEELVYTIAHDLRAPLRSIQGFATMIQENSSLPEEDRAVSERIVRAAASMDALTRDLLEYGRVARAEVQLEPVSLMTAWQGAVAQCEAAVRDSNGVLESPEAMPSVRGHQPILTQVMANLLSNALKFVPEGRAPRVQVGAEPQEGRVRFWMRDNGIGIAKEYHERIFQVFERLESRHYKGTGIGLSIVRKGIERMGGRVGLESQPGVGSCFWFELPSA
jgi:signal transduction histidine kinase